MVISPCFGPRYATCEYDAGPWQTDGEALHRTAKFFALN
jgi:hypothetical protein